MCKLVFLERIFGGLDQLGVWFLDKYHIKCQLWGSLLSLLWSIRNNQTKLSLSSSAVAVLGDNPHCLKLSSC